MKKTILVLMLLGVVTLSAKPKYRIETFVINGTKMYQPQQRVWFKTSIGTLPFRVWVSGDYPFHNKPQAEEIIENWKHDSQLKKKYKKSEYYYYN